MASQSSTHSVLLSSQWLVDLCWLFLLRCSSPFSYFHVWEFETKNEPFRSVSLTGGNVLTGRSEGSHPCILEPFLSHLQMFAKEVFWFNCSLLDYVIMAFEFFIRSFLSWSLRLRGTCFLAFDVFEKVRLFVSLLLCFDSLTPSLGSILMCRAQLCASAAWDVFVAYFCTGHKSPLLLPSLQVVMKAGYCWPVHLENLCLLTAVQKIQYFNERHATFAWRDGWHCSNCPFSPQAFSPGKKLYHYNSFIKRIFFTFCCICFLDDFNWGARRGLLRTP